VKSPYLARDRDVERAIIDQAKRLGDALTESPYGYEAMEALVYRAVKKWGEEAVVQLVERAMRTC
jgi:hypothetical protein